MKRLAALTALLALLTACTPNTPPLPDPTRPPATQAPQADYVDPEHPPEGYISVGYGAITIQVPEDYTVDGSQLDYNGVVNIDHPAWPDVMDRASMTYHPGAEREDLDALLAGAVSTFVSLANDSEVEVGDWELYVLRGRMSLFGGEEYDGDYHLFFREGELYEILLLSDGTDPRLIRPEGCFIFEPDRPYDGLSVPRGLG